ncbi:MAG TPA: hypothetical protein VMC61_05635, partial [Methanocella sp.]|nr:hypothetical protein [Methanocella sp.]
AGAIVGGPDNFDADRETVERVKKTVGLGTEEESDVKTLFYGMLGQEIERSDTDAAADQEQFTVGFFNGEPVT